MFWEPEVPEIVGALKKTVPEVLIQDLDPFPRGFCVFCHDPFLYGWIKREL
jgi:hypothetical protein